MASDFVRPLAVKDPRVDFASRFDGPLQQLNLTPDSPFQREYYKSIETTYRTGSIGKIMTVKLRSFYESVKNREKKGPAPFTDQLSERIDRWPQDLSKETRIIGKGTAGTVYQVLDPVFKAQIALKINKCPEVVEPNSLSALRAIPHIVKYYGACRMGEKDVAICMEFAGITLKERISKAPLKLKEALSLSIQLLQTHDAYSNMGWIHGDLKPSNLTFNGNSLKVLDFGLAAPLNSFNQQANKIQSLGFRAPEVILGGPWDRSTDLWSIGVVTFYAIFKQTLFFGSSDSSDGWIEILLSIGKLIGPPPESFLAKCENREFLILLIDQYNSSNEEYLNRFKKTFYEKIPENQHRAIPYLIRFFLGIFRYEERISSSEALFLCEQAIKVIN